MNKKDKEELLSLINVIITDLSSESVKLSNSLAKAKKIASKLKDNHLNNFITYEIEGKFDVENFPEYRIFNGNPKGVFQNKYTGVIQHVPLQFHKLLEQAGGDPKESLKRQIINSVSEMEEFYKVTNTKSLMIEFGQNQMDFVRKYLIEDESNGWYLKSGYFEFSFTTYTQIMSVVRNRLIEMLLKIDEELKCSLNVNSESFFENGQCFDAILDLSDKIAKAKKVIILIDGYVNENTFKFFANKMVAVHVKILTNKKSIDSRLELFINAFNAQYQNLEIRSSEAFHDRFIIIDNKSFFHVGSSIKDAGKKTFMITEIEERFIQESVLKKFEDEWSKK